MHPTQSTTQTDAIALDDLLPIEKFAEAYPNILTVLSLRWMMRNRHANGLDVACVKLGKRIMISRSRFETWLASQTEDRRAAA